jgi:glycosyltransferase involved in cell wall biosynthesis
MLKSPYFANEPMPAAERNRLLRSSVNALYNRASCGLALSALEGAMRASVEYLLAGLPVVTTVNKGGRDYYLDGRFSAHVADDSLEIARAVDEFAAQQISPEFIRSETMKKQLAGRMQFAEDIAKLCDVDHCKIVEAVQNCTARENSWLVWDTVDNFVAQYG